MDLSYFILKIESSQKLGYKLILFFLFIWIKYASIQILNLHDDLLFLLLSKNVDFTHLLVYYDHKELIQNHNYYLYYLYRIIIFYQFLNILVNRLLQI